MLSAGQLICHLSGFSTAAVPDAVATDGQVRYEITLRVVGAVPQIGWATPKFEATTENSSGEGTGDNAYSWGADGARQLTWHNGEAQKGTYDIEWSAGNVIGIAADLEAGTLSFAKHGVWVEAFKGCDFGDEGIFPSITMNGKCEVNLGASPFKFPGPNDNYKPVGPGISKLECYRGGKSAFEGSFDEVGALRV